MPASLMMTPPLAPTLERKWPTWGDHQDAMLEDLSSSRPLLHHFMQFFVSSLATPHRPTAAPAHHERFRLLGQTAECAAANQRCRRQCWQSSCSLRTPARPQRRAAFSQLSIPPASQDSALSDEKAAGQDAGLYPPVVYVSSS